MGYAEKTSLGAVIAVGAMFSLGAVMGALMTPLLQQQQCEQKAMETIVSTYTKEARE